MLGRGILLRLADSPKVERFVKRNGMSAGFARRFVAGETLEDTVDPVRALNAQGIAGSLDYLGENVTQATEAAESTAYYHRLFDFIEQRSLNANVSLKLSQLGLDLSHELALGNLRSIVEKAREYNQFVRVDMESSKYAEQTLELFYRLWQTHKNFGVVIQSYLYRSAGDIERLIEAGARVRLVKGAYAEPANVAFQRKADVDANFVRLMERLLDQGNYPGIATHDERMIQATIAYAQTNKIESSRFEFQMLFGIRRDRQIGLVAEGHRTRVYVPFGSQWYAYMMRRLAERPANLWFVVKNLLRR